MNKQARDGKMIGVNPTPELRARIEQIAAHEGRSLSQVCFYLIQKGLAVYEKDNDLLSARNLPFRRGKKPKNNDED